MVFSFPMVDKMAAILFFDHWKTELQEVRYSNVVGFQAPTVKATWCRPYKNALCMQQNSSCLRGIQISSKRNVILCSFCPVNVCWTLRWKNTIKGDMNIDDHLNTRNIWILNILKFGFRMIRYSNGQFTFYVLCTRLTIWILDQYIQMVGLFGIQMLLEYRTVWHLTFFRSFEYKTRSLFRSPLYLYDLWYNSPDLPDKDWAFSEQILLRIEASSWSSAAQTIWRTATAEQSDPKRPIQNSVDEAANEGIQGDVIFHRSWRHQYLWRHQVGRRWGWVENWR